MIPETPAIGAAREAAGEVEGKKTSDVEDELVLVH